MRSGDADGGRENNTKFKKNQEIIASSKEVRAFHAALSSNLGGEGRVSPTFAIRAEKNQNLASCLLYPPDITVRILLFCL
jgi:hypothetical protein